MSAAATSLAAGSDSRVVHVPSSSSSSSASDSEKASLSAHSLASASSQSLAGIAERLIRPMLSRSLTEEVQAFVCLNEAAYRAFDQSSLSTYAQLTLRPWTTKDDAHQRYASLSGMDWATTTFEQRYAATSCTRMPCERRWSASAAG